MIETWILILTIWTAPDFTPKEERIEFPSHEECVSTGQEKVAEAVPNPASWFCFKKGA